MLRQRPLLPVLLLLLLTPPTTAINPGGFPNGVLKSVRGWRSWNAVMEDVTHSSSPGRWTLSPPGGSESCRQTRQPA